MAEPKPSTTGWHVRVSFKMLVYDHRCYKYLTFPAISICNVDASGMSCRFDHMKSEGGFDRLLPLETFNTSNGFLDDNDSCILGVELSVLRDTGEGEYLSIIKDLKKNTFTWTIPNFSDMEDGKNWSDQFTVGGDDYPWYEANIIVTSNLSKPPRGVLRRFLCLYPKGYGKSYGKSISLYLYLGGNAAIPEGGKLYAEYKLRMKNHSGDRKKHCVKEDHYWFSPKSYSEGFEDFVALSSLKDQGLKLNDTLIVEVEITFMATPLENRYKINFDAALFIRECAIGIGVVVRGNKGLSKKIMGSLTPENAEALAASEAVFFGLECGFRDVTIEGDAANSSI
ncbi:hypothetical protein RJ639_010264 [Escallonia herrerae]|uniref:MATH domain-containing protein n=1 Tax=Escallonia herrerae TaxID=1293975 RepID=A0AA88VPY1_9ASTE|nr:hypothetical protein RJ639_010264 [Escallonia herrerae]